MAPSARCVAWLRWASGVRAKAVLKLHYSKFEDFIRFSKQGFLGMPWPIFRSARSSVVRPLTGACDYTVLRQRSETSPNIGHFVALIPTTIMCHHRKRHRKEKRSSGRGRSEVCRGCPVPELSVRTFCIFLRELSPRQRTAELSLRTFWTLLRELSSRRRRRPSSLRS